MDFTSTIGQIAPLIKAGLAAHWLKPRQKRPVEKLWSEKPVASLADLKASYETDQNIGVRLGEPSKIGELYLHLIDLDIRNPETASEARAALKKIWPDYELAPFVISGSGGDSRHFYLLSDRPFHSRKIAHSENFTRTYDVDKGRDVKHWDWEIELFGTGKQAVLPPSIHPDTGQPYVWGRPIDLDDIEMGLGPEVPASAIEEWFPARETEVSDEIKPALGLEVEEARAILAELPLPAWCEDRDGWLQVGMALHHEFGDEDGFALWCEFSKQSAKFNEKDQKAVWKSFRAKPNSVRMATLVRAVADKRLRDAFEEVPDDDEEDLLGDPDSDDDEEDLLGDPEPDPPAAPEIDWMSKLARGGEKKVVLPTLSNVALIVGNEPRLKGVCRYNEFVKEIYQAAEPGVFKPRRPGPKGTVQLDSPTWRLSDDVNGDIWTDAHDNGVRWLLDTPDRQGGWSLKVAQQDIRQAIDIAARRNPYHPVRNYLNSLKWDGKKRIDTLFVRYLGCDDDTYHRHISRLMLTAAVTRVFEPGHKFDYVVILEGLQGKGKSTFIETLAKYPTWYAELDGDFEDTKAMVEKMQGSWILELPELQGFSRAEVNDIKKFVSGKRDKCRLAFAHRADVYPRQCIFMGSTNEHEYLRDPTGGRRWWPAFCHIDDIDIESLAGEVDQIWAEALAEYRAMRQKKPKGVLPLYLADAEAAEMAMRLQETRRIETAEEPLAREIQMWLDTPMPGDFDDEEPTERTATCLKQIWVEALGRHPAQYDNRQSQSLGKAMRMIEGWDVERNVIVPKYGRGRGYVRKRKKSD